MLDSMNGQGYRHVVAVLETYIKTVLEVSSLELETEELKVYNDTKIQEYEKKAFFCLVCTGNTTREPCGLWHACPTQHATIFSGWCYVESHILIK